MNPETANVAPPTPTIFDATCGSSTNQAGQWSSAPTRWPTSPAQLRCFATQHHHHICGPYAASTPTKTFVYDATTFTCSGGQSNVKTTIGRSLYRSHFGQKSPTSPTATHRAARLQTFLNRLLIPAATTNPDDLLGEWFLLSRPGHSHARSTGLHSRRRGSSVQLTTLPTSIRSS